MASKMLRHITTNRDYYQKAFLLFREKCKKAEVDRAWVENVFPSEVVGNLRQPPKGELLRSLGIGSGAGEFEAAQLKELLKRFGNIHHTVVEPAQAFVSQYQSFVETDKASFAGVDFNWWVDTMQKFLDRRSAAEGGANKRKFNFISSAHSLYYFVDSLPEALRFYHDEMLEYGGIFMVAVTTGNSSNTKFVTRFPSLYDQTADATLFNGDDVKKALESLRLSYSMHTQPSATDISAVFDSSRSEEGAMILDFLTHSIDFQGTAQQPLRGDVIDFLRSEECCRLCDDGAVLFENPWDTFFIQKKA